MGLDTVELVMNVEEAFDIKIPDTDAHSLTTVGELYDYIVARTMAPRTGTCLTASAFYDLRAGLESCGVVERFGPSTRLEEILPKANRRPFWSQLSRSMGLELPKLVRPVWVTTTNGVATVAASVVVALACMGSAMTEGLFLLLGVVCLFFFGYVTAMVTIPFATRFDSTFDTFRGLSEQVLALNSQKLRNQHGPMGRHDIWVVLRGLIVETLGVEQEEVTRDANFVKDLGCE